MGKRHIAATLPVVLGKYPKGPLVSKLSTKRVLTFLPGGVNGSDKCLIMGSDGESSPLTKTLSTTVTAVTTAVSYTHLTLPTKA